MSPDPVALVMYLPPDCEQSRRVCALVFFFPSHDTQPRAGPPLLLLGGGISGWHTR